jgi:Zn-dependent protease
MLPIKPLDGFNILNLLLEKIISNKKRKRCIKIIEKIVENVFLMIAILVAVKKHNFSLIIIAVYIKTNSLKPLKSL